MTHIGGFSSNPSLIKKWGVHFELGGSILIVGLHCILRFRHVCVIIGVGTHWHKWALNGPWMRVEVGVLVWDLGPRRHATISASQEDKRAKC